jgi:hypothetical protein
MSAFDVLVILLAAFLLYLVIPNVVPVLRSARAGDGVPGIFTARHLTCVAHPGHTACGWEGSFRSDSGTIDRGSVYLYGGSGGLTAGSQIKARDIGRASQVYRFSGTHEWVITAILFVVSLLLLLYAGVYRAVRSGISRLAAPSAKPGRTITS